MLYDHNQSYYVSPSVFEYVVNYMYDTGHISRSQRVANSFKILSAVVAQICHHFDLCSNLNYLTAFLWQNIIKPRS